VVNAQISGTNGFDITESVKNSEGVAALEDLDTVINPRRCGNPEVREKLQELSAATIDRMLSVRKKRMRLKARSVTKPGTLLKQKIPVRTFADWDDARPGFIEMDMVAHEGGNPSGEYALTLNLTDVD